MLSDAGSRHDARSGSLSFSAPQTPGGAPKEAREWRSPAEKPKRRVAFEPPEEEVAAL